MHKWNKKLSQNKNHFGQNKNWWLLKLHAFSFYTTKSTYTNIQIHIQAPTAEAQAYTQSLRGRKRKKKSLCLIEKTVKSWEAWSCRNDTCHGPAALHCMWSSLSAYCCFRDWSRYTTKASSDNRMTAWRSAEHRRRCCYSPHRQSTPPYSLRRHARTWQCCHQWLVSHRLHGLGRGSLNAVAVWVLHGFRRRQR